MGIGRGAAVLLGVLFLWAGIAKLADRGWPASALAFGISRAAAQLVGPLELVLGAVLVTIGGPIPCAVAFGVLVVYTLVITAKLASNDVAPPCACFGGVSARPISWRTIVRNVVLLALAVIGFTG